jgi:Phage integrase, N-terminal SAM-like domain
MAYDWRPTAARSVTTDSHVAVRPRADRTVAAAVEEFVTAMEQGVAVNRSGRQYRPSALRDLRGILNHHVVPSLGQMPLRDVRRQDVQSLVDRLVADGLSESRIRSVVSALRALYGYAIERGQVEFNPVDGLVMSSGDEPEQRVWEEPPAWEDSPAREAPPAPEDPPAREDPPAWRDPIAWQDRTGQHDRQERPSARERRKRDRKARARPERERVAYEPIAQLPERILSLALRAVFVIFVLIALVSLLGPA